MSNSNHSIGLQRLKPVHTAYGAICMPIRKLVLGTRRKWPRPRRDRDETLVRLESVSRPRRRDRDHNPASLSDGQIKRCLFASSVFNCHPGCDDGIVWEFQFATFSAEKLLLHLTRKERDDKNDLNQSKAEPWMPNQDDRRVSSMLWSMVSKAAERSRRQRQDTFCEPVALIRWDVNVEQSSFSAVVLNV